MSWRTVVISNSAKLDYQMGFLVVRKAEPLKIHIDEIHTLILESTAISITGALLAELTKKKVKVIFCDEKRNPSSELIPYYGCFDTSSKIREQIKWSKETKSLIWTEIVSEKIKKQSELLLEMGHKEASKMLDGYVREIAFADETNREGHAAKVYFNSLFGKDFSRASENSINAALNYGYSLILSTVNREIVANGYITELGLFHDNMFNPFNLSSDLMEPFRPIIDREVIAMKPEVFEHDEKVRIVELMKKEVNIAGRNEYLTNAIKIYVRSVFDALNDSDSSLVKFYRL